MEIILLEDVPKLGKIGDLLKVKHGYARNFLFPRKMAIAASVNSRRQLEHEKRIVGFRLAKARAEAETMAARLGALKISIARKVGEQDKMFGSVTPRDIQQALAEHGVELDRRDIHMDEPLKTLGVHSVAVRLTGGVQAHVNVSVVAG